jgi:hypothetical protein
MQRLQFPIAVSQEYRNDGVRRFASEIGLRLPLERGIEAYQAVAAGAEARIVIEP